MSVLHTMPAANARRTEPAEALVVDGRARYSIRVCLAALVVVCLLPAVIAVATMAYANYRAREGAALGEAVTRARTMMLLIERDLEGVESGLRVLATAHEIVANDLPRFQERLRIAQKSQIVRNYVLVDREGRQRINTLLPFGTPLPQLGLSSPLAPVLETGRTLLTGVFPASHGGVPIVTMGVPIFRAGEVAYALAVAIEPARIMAATDVVTLPEGWVASVVDSNGNIVARSRDAADFVGKPETPSVLAAIAGRDEGTSEVTTKDGTVAMGAFSRSLTRDWTVIVGAPKAPLLAELYRSLGYLVGGGLVALAIILFFSFQLSRMVTGAVSGLVESAIALGSGRPIELRPTSLRETDAVDRAIWQASRMLSAAQHHAYHDPLTNLRNRTLFDELALRQIAQAYRDGAQFAILAIDLDGFKEVNDQHGHAAGDEVLKVVAQRITGLIRTSDVVSRRGGDEFSVLLVDVDGIKTRQVAEKLLAALSKPYPDVSPVVSASIGVARYPHDATNLEDLLERADVALYAAKNAGKNRIVGEF